MPRKKRGRQDDFEDEYYEDDGYGNGYDDSGYDDEPYYDETGITDKSLSKARRYVVISILFLLLCIGGFFGIQTLGKAKVVNARNNCWMNEYNVEKVASNYILTNGLMSYPAYIEDVSDYSEPSCPSGGTYTWDPVGGEYVCSEHGHYPKGFGDPKSQDMGTQQIVTEDD